MRTIAFELQEGLLYQIKPILLQLDALDIPGSSREEAMTAAVQLLSEKNRNLLTHFLLVLCRTQKVQSAATELGDAQMTVESLATVTMPNLFHGGDGGEVALAEHKRLSHTVAWLIRHYQIVAKLPDGLSAVAARLDSDAAVRAYVRYKATGKGRNRSRTREIALKLGLAAGKMFSNLGATKKRQQGVKRSPVKPTMAGKRPSFDITVGGFTTAVLPPGTHISMHECGSITVPKWNVLVRCVQKQTI